MTSVHGADPKVTILMSVYNGEQFLRIAIDSILTQKFRDFEFLIMDDGSTDGTAEIIRSYNDTRIMYHDNGNNLGLSRSLNLGISFSRGELIARFDADDVSLPDRIQKEVDYFERHPEVGLIAGGFQRINQEGKKIGQPIIHPEESYILKYWLSFESVLCQPAAMMRRTALDKAGLYDPAFTVAEDFDLWGRIAAVTEVANLQEVLILHREHMHNVSISLQDSIFHNHVQISRRQVKSLTGKDYPPVLFENMITKKKVNSSMARKIIDLYLDTARKYCKKYQLSKEQKKRLWYTLSWRINKVLQRTPSRILLTPEAISMYWNNHDLLIRNLRNPLKKGR